MPYTPTVWKTGDIVSSEKLNKLEQGVADATSEEIIDSWLEENISQETGYVLDRTLSMSNAAAPADLVGAQSAKIDEAMYSIGNDLTAQTTWNGFIINSDGSYGSQTGNTMKSFKTDGSEYVYVAAAPLTSGYPVGGFYSANGVSKSNLVEIISSSGFVKVPQGGTYVILSYATDNGCVAKAASSKFEAVNNELKAFENDVSGNIFPINCTYELGTINSSTGAETASTQFVRSKETIECLDDILLHLDITHFYVVLYFYDSEGRYSSYTGYVNGTSYQLRKGNRFRIVLATNPLTANPDISVFENAVKTQYWSDVISTGDSETVITIGEDYDTIGEAITYLNGLTDQFSSYKIYIPNGTYNENTLTVNHRNVTIEGESENGVVIYVDGSNTTGSEANKHGLKMANSGKVKNLTIKVDYVKYCVHQDGIGRPYEVFFENCTFIYGSSNEGYKYCIGVGARELENLYFENCAFVKLGTESDAGIYWHNDYASTNLSNKLHVDHCSFYNCGVLVLQENGSVDNVYEDISLHGIVTNSENYGVSISVISSSIPSGMTADDITYRICVNCDSKIPKLELTNRVVEKYYQLAACAETVVVNE